jgi:branched-chain amino acid transport system ATP-binding protein
VEFNREIRAMITDSARPRLEARGLSLTFGGFTVLDDIKANFPSGEITGLIGPNGAGKTSLFNCLTGLYRPQRGTIRFSGTQFDDLPPTMRARYGLSRSFQHVALCPDLTAIENVMFGLSRLGRSGWAGALLGLPLARAEEVETRARARQALDRLGIAAVEDLLPSALPPGTLRLVEIARANVGEPKILLLDEPAAGLNAAETRELTRVLRQLATPDLVMVVVEHDMDLIMEICDSIYVLNFGKLIAHGSPDEVRRDSEVARIYLGADDD